MKGPNFLDTNILVYAYEKSDENKQRIARRLVRLALAGELLTSTQVIAEFSATLLRKMSPGAKPSDLASLLDVLEPIKLVFIDFDVIKRALEACAKYGVHFYDGMILAAAERAQCSIIWSEDFNAGQEYFGVRVQNPFV